MGLTAIVLGAAAGGGFPHWNCTCDVCPLAWARPPGLDGRAGAPPGPDEVSAAAAAEQTLARRRATADLLETLGVDVIDVPSDALPPALADHYLALKARGLL